MRNRILSLALLATSVFTTPLFAQDGTSFGGKVVHVASVDGALLFSIAGGNQANRPACANSGRFAVAETSIHASVVLTAFSTGKALGSVQGKGQCTLWSNAEDIRWIEVCPVGGCS